LLKGVNVAIQRKSKRPNPQELARREDIFRVYRDLGPARSYNRLIVAIRDKFGEVNKRQLMTWSKEYSWQERLHVHDAEEEKRRALALAEQDALDPNFDQQDALLRAAAKALKRALEATVTVAIKPSELKALVDTAVNAIKLVEMLRSGEARKNGHGSGNKRMFAVLDALEARLRAGAPQQGAIIDVTPGAAVPETSAREIAEQVRCQPQLERSAEAGAVVFPRASSGFLPRKRRATY
jgi:hypothetical protein